MADPRRVQCPDCGSLANEPCNPMDQTLPMGDRGLSSYHLARHEASESSAYDHPAHYGGADNPYETIKVIEAWGWDRDYLLGNALKYMTRAGKKDPAKTVEDLRKAVWHLERKITNLEKEGS